MNERSRILIVDDQLSARDTLDVLLSAEGYVVAFASDGVEALAKAAELVPDVILLDVMMPDMDGFEVCRRLRADPRLASVPVILVTALDDRASRLQGLEAGADDFVSKPFDSAELRARVRTITQLNRYRQLLVEHARRQQAEEELGRLYQQLQHHAESLEETVAVRTFELQTERDRTQAILEALGEAVVVTDVDGTIRYFNPAATALTGFSGQEALGHNWRLWQTDHQLPEFYTRIQAAVCAGQTWRGEVINQRRDGALYEAALTVAPLCDPHDPACVAGFVSIQRDITPLKQAERLKDQFVSNVSHELRTPLSIITLHSGNLDTFYEQLDDEQRRKIIRSIRQHTLVLDELIGSVLEISRIDSQRISTQRQPVDLARLVREEAGGQSPLAQEKSQSLQVSGAEHLAVWGDGTS